MYSLPQVKLPGPEHPTGVCAHREAYHQWSHSLTSGFSHLCSVGGHDLSGRIRLADTQSLQIPPGLAVYLYAQRDFKRLSWVLLHSHSDLDRIKIARRVKSIVIAPVGECARVCMCVWTCTPSASHLRRYASPPVLADHVLVYPVCTFRGKPLVMGAGAYVEGFGSKCVGLQPSPRQSQLARLPAPR